MPLNKSKGNMYPFVTHTWNAIKGKCPHDCAYCYMKRFKQNDLRLDRKEFKTKLGQDNFIFVGSSCDMWAEDIPAYWIFETLDCCRKFENKYLFQTKNPARMLDFINELLVPDCIIGTTIETNRDYPEMGKTPSTINRALALKELSNNFPVMVTIEPVMNFDVPMMELYIGACNPAWVNIGADSKNSGLPEPGADKINELIKNLKLAGIEVKTKNNLKRLL